MKTLKHTMFCSLALSASLSGHGVADVPHAYEGFEYGSSPNLLLKDGGFGWSTAWGKVNQITTGVLDEGLAFAQLETTGGSAITPPFPSSEFTAYSRGLDPYDTGSGDVYISFLFRPNIGYGLGGGLAFGPFANGMVIGAHPASGHYGLWTPPDDLSADSDLTLAQGQTALLVAHVHATDSGTTWSLFVDPVVGEPEPATSDAMLAVPMSLPQNVMIFNDGGFSTDEIRVGPTWESVLPAKGNAADLDGDGAVDGTDLGLLLAAWGSSQSGADLDHDGVVGGSDLGLLLGSWT